MAQTRYEYLVAEIERLKEQPTNECVEWPYSKTSRGYGNVQAWGKSETVHRVAYQLFYREEPFDCILHTCDNPPCFNPAHLFAGTQQENVLDCIRKRRRFIPQCGYVPKISPSALTIIIELFTSGVSQTEIAKMFGVHISSINKHLNWLGYYKRKCQRKQVRNNLASPSPARRRQSAPAWHAGTGG